MGEKKSHSSESWRRNWKTIHVFRRNIQEQNELACSIHLGKLAEGCLQLGVVRIWMNDCPVQASLSLRIFKLNHNLTSWSATDFPLSMYDYGSEDFHGMCPIWFHQRYLYIQWVNLSTSLIPIFRLCTYKNKDDI